MTTTIVTRLGKGSPLTNTELDANFTNLKTTADAALPAAGGTISGSLIITSDLEVRGTTTSIDSTTVEITDLNITLAKDATNNTQANGAGITIAGSNAELKYVSTGDKWTVNKNLSLADSIKLTFGNDDDLEIYHDGNHSRISDLGTGRLVLETNGDSIRLTKGTTENMAIFTPDGSVDLYHNNSKKFETTSGGIKVTGDISNTSGNLTLDSAADIILDADGADVIFADGGTQYGFIANSSSDMVVKPMVQDKDFIIKGNDGGSTITALTLDMSQSGEADFNSAIKVAGGIVAHQTNRGVLEYASNVFKIRSYGATSGSGSITLLTGGGGNNSDTVALTLDSNQNASFAGTISSGAITSTGLEINGTRNFDSDYNVTYYRKANHTTLGYQLFRDDGKSYYEWNNGGAHTHDLQFLSNNSPVLNLSTNGNVIIPNGNLMVGSTTAPSDKMEIVADSGHLRLKGSTTATKGLALLFDNSNNRSEIRSDQAGVNQLDLQYYALNHNFGRNASNITMHLSDDNKVGIGNQNPTDKLHIESSENGGVQIQVDNQNTGNASYAGLYLNGQGNNFFLKNWGDAVSGKSNGTEFISTAGSSFFMFSTANAERMRLSAAGDLGINTTAPDSKLHIAEDAFDQTIVKLNFSSADSSAGNYAHFGEIRLSGHSTNCNTAIRSYSNAFQNSNGALAFWTQEHGGSFDERMRILGDGKIGIGTTSPSQPLTVSGADSVGIDDYVLHNGDTNTKFGFNAADSFKVRTGGTDRFIIGNTNSYFTTNVGIGTTSPSAKLQIQGGTSGLDQISISSNTTADTIKYAGIIMTNYANTTTALIGAKAENGTSSVFYGSSGTDHRGIQNHIFYTNASATATSGNTERMRIDSSGNVGIGVTSPAVPLDVHSNSSAEGIRVRGRSSDNIGQITLTDSGGTARNQIQGSATYLNIKTFPSSPIAFFTGGTERGRFGSSGNLGLGTTSPNSKLHVYDGNIELESPSGSGGRYLSLNNTATGGRDYRIISTNDSHGSLGGGKFAILDNDVSGNDAAKTRIFMDSIGRVGIGTVSPAHKLTVSSSNNTTPLGIDIGTHAHFDFMANSTSGYTTTFNMDDTGLDIGHDSSLRSLNLKTAGSDRLTINGSGNVGVGTSSPRATFDLRAGHSSTVNEAISFGRTDDNFRYNSIFSRNTSSTGSYLSFKIHDGSSASSQTEVMAITPLGVGIGTTSPETKLQISHNGGHTSGTVQIAESSFDLFNPIEADTNEKGSVVTFSDHYYDGTNYIRTTRAGIKGGTDEAGNNGAGFLSFYTNQNGGANTLIERARFDKSGNLLVGKTAADFTVAGHEIRNGSYAGFTRAGLPLLANRLSSDGDIIEFYKNTASIGSIGVVGGDDLFIGGGSTGLRFDSGVGKIYPTNGSGTVSDNTVDIGEVNYRFKDLHLSNIAHIGNKVSFTNSANSSGVDIGLLGGSSDATGFIFQRANDSLVFGTNNTEVARFTSNNLALGTTSTSSDAIVRFLHVANSTSAGVVLDAARKFSIFSSSSSTLTVRDETASANRLILNSDGQVGIGETSVNTDASVEISKSAPNTGVTALRLTNAVNNKGQRIDFEDDNGVRCFTLSHDNGSNLTYMGNLANESFAFYTNSLERSRLTAGGNLLIGKTADNDTSAGIRFQSNGSGSFVRDNNVALQVNRLTGNGNLIELRKDSSLIGAIGVDSGDNLYIAGSASNHAGVYLGTNIVAPLSAGSLTDNAVDIGNSSYRFQDAHFSGTVNAATGSFTQTVTSFGITSNTNGIKLQSLDTSVNSGESIGDIEFSSSDASGGGSGVQAKISAVADNSFGTSYALSFLTGSSANPTEKVKILSTGTLLIGGSTTSASGTTSFSASGAGQINFNASSSAGQCLLLRRDNHNGNAITFENIDEDEVGSITMSSNATAYNTSSDARLKDNIEDADDSGETIDAIKVRQYDWKSTGKHQNHGMIAQELQKIVPEAVSGDAESEEMMGIDYSKLVAMLVKEIQSLRQRVAQLEE